MVTLQEVEQAVVVISILGGAVYYVIKLEARLKELESEVRFLEPMKNILRMKGIEQVEKVFKKEKK